MNAAGWDWWTPLHCAAGIGHMPLVRLLHEAGADLNVRDGSGMTPAEVAVSRRHDATARLLVEEGADCTVYLAVCLGDRKSVESLLANGADAQVKTAEGETALQRAVAMDFVEIVALLGGDPNDPALGQSQRSALVRDPRDVWSFLLWEGVEFDDIWVPPQVDFRGYESSLKSFLAGDTEGPTDVEISPRYLLTNFNAYGRQYSGFVHDGVKYIVCCLDRLHNAFVVEDVGFPLVYDGGCGIVIVVFEADTKKVVHIHCHGVA